jgi:hypothetical protein
MNGDIDHTSLENAAADAVENSEPIVQPAFPTRDGALALALKIAGPKIPDDAAV